MRLMELHLVLMLVLMKDEMLEVMMVIQMGSMMVPKMALRKELLMA